MPGWSASTTQMPAATNVRVPAEVILQTAGAEEENDTGKPESEVAVTVGVVPKFCAPGLVNVIAWPAAGVTPLDAGDATPVPELLVAVTVKVYAVPLARPVTTIGELVPVPVKPPGPEVTV